MSALSDLINKQTREEKIALAPPRQVPFKLPLEDALSLLKKDRVLVGLAPYAPQATIAQPAKGYSWSEVSRRLSHLVGGQVWAGAQGLSHNPCGNRKVEGAPKAHWVFRRDVLPDILSAREIAKKTTGTYPESFAQSGSARHLISWTGLYQDPFKNRATESFVAGTKWHFYHCEPGDLPQGHLFDMQACYWELASRLISPYVAVLRDGSPLFLRAPKEARERFKAVLHAIRPHKGLRNTLIGCMAGGEKTFWSNGEERGPLRFQGPLRPAALLIVGTAWQLTREAREERAAIYSNTDCVITRADEPPRAWTDRGLPCPLKSAGKTKVCSLGVYKVGDKATDWFWQGSRFKAPISSPEIVRPELLDWLL